VPFFIIVPLWILVVLMALPLFFIRRLRFLATHVVIASTLAVLISGVLSTAILVGGPRLPPSRLTAVLIVGFYLLSIPGGGVVGLLIGILIAHRLNKRLAWWPIPPSTSTLS
jgi:hypothetical protein